MLHQYWWPIGTINGILKKWMTTVIAKYNDTTELSVYIKTGTYNTQELPCGIREAGNPELVKNGYKYHIQQLTTR